MLAIVIAMIIQTDADGTIYSGNLLVSLGWKYLFYLFQKRRYAVFFSRLIELPFFYFLSCIPGYVHTAFIPFRDCPVCLANQVNNRLKKEWLEKIKQYGSGKIIIITHQDRYLLMEYLKNRGLTKRYDFDLISNEGIIKNGRYSGKARIWVNASTKYDYIRKNRIFMGDYKDYLYYGARNENFVLIK